MKPEERQAELDRLAAIVGGASTLRATLATVDAEFTAAMGNVCSLHQKRSELVADIATADKASEELVALKATESDKEPAAETVSEPAAQEEDSDDAPYKRSHHKKH